MKFPIFGIGAAAVLGIAAILFVTGSGIGTTPDSSAYIGAARSILAGKGVSLPQPGGTTTPLVFVAPFYPVLLAGTGLLGLDPAAGARWLNALLFGANIVLFAAIARSFASKDFWVPLAGAFALLVSIPFLGIHAYAWTEPAFIFLGFGGLFLLARYIENGPAVLLPVASVMLGLAWVTRYAGAPFVAAGALGLLLMGRGCRHGRMLSAGVVAVVGAAPLLVWTLRNIFTAGSATGRELVFHPVTKAHAWQVVFTVSGWLHMPDSTPGIVRLGALMCLLAVAVFVILREHQAGHAAGLPVVLRLVALFMVTYGAFLIVSISFLDANTPLDDRILSPMYAGCLLVILYVLHRIVRVRSARPLTGWSIAVAGVAVLFLSAVQAASWLDRGRLQGLGFSSPAWQRSETIRKVAALPPGSRIFSNSPDAIYLVTGRAAQALPRKAELTTGRPNSSYFSELGEIRKQGRGCNNAIVLFRNIARHTRGAEDELVRDLSLRMVASASDGTIYALPETP